MRFYRSSIVLARKRVASERPPLHHNPKKGQTVPTQSRPTTPSKNLEQQAMLHAAVRRGEVSTSLPRRVLSSVASFFSMWSSLSLRSAILPSISPNSLSNRTFCSRRSILKHGWGHMRGYIEVSVRVNTPVVFTNLWTEECSRGFLLSACGTCNIARQAGTHATPPSFLCVTSPLLSSENTNRCD